MTLSNNAIKFLQAQYRAIFKRAYIKGLATAVLLTAGLAAGQAQADNNPLVDNESSAFTSLDVVYDQGDHTYSGGEAWANSVTISNGANVTISGSGSVHVNESVLVTGSGTSLTLNSAFNGSISDEGGDESKPLNDPTGAMTISDGATLTVSGTSSYFDDFNVKNATVNIGGQVGGTDQSGSIADSTQLWVGQADGVSVIEGEKTEINLNSHSVLTFGRDAYLRDGVVTFDGADEFDALLQGNKSKTTYLQGTDFIVEQNNTGAILANHINMSAGTITNNGALVISGRNSASKSSGGEMEGATFHAADIVMTGGEIINASGATLTIGAAKETAWNGGVANTTFTATGGKITNTGKVNFYASDIELSNENFAGLLTVEDSKSGSVAFNYSGSTNLTVDGAVDLNGLGILSGDGTLTDNFKISSGSVNLTAGTISLDSAYKVGNLSLDAGTLNIDGNDEDKNKFIFSSGTITVRNALNGAAATDRVVIRAANAGDSATLNLIASGEGKVTNIDRFNVGWTSNASGTSTLNVDGTWDFGGARVTASNNGNVTFGGTVGNVSQLMLEKNGQVTVNGALTVGRLLAGENNHSGSVLNINGSLTVTGDGKADKGTQNYYNDVYLTKSTVNINNGGTLALTTADALDDFISVTKNDEGSITAISVVSSGGNTTDVGGWDKDKVTLNAGGSLQLNLADLGVTTITQDQLTTLKSGLVASGSKGSFNFGEGLTIELDESLQTAIDSGEVSYGSLSSGGVNDVQGVADGVTVTVTATEASTGINLSNGASAVKLASGTTSVAVDGTLALNGNGGNFVYAENTPNDPADVSVKANSGVNLTGAGTVGALVKNGSDTGTSAVLTAGQDATQTVQGEINLDTVTIGQGTVKVADNVTADTLTLDGNLTNAAAQGTTAKTITATTLTQNGGTLTTNTLTIGAGSSAESTSSELKGVVKADSITINKSKITTPGGGNVINIINDSLVAAETFTAASGSVINVGTDGGSGTSSTGTLDVGTLTLSGATLTIDPIYGLGYASTIVSELSTNNTLDGSVNIGQNSILAVGFKDKAELNSFLAENKLLDSNGSLFAENGSLLIVNDAMTIADGYGVALNGTHTPASVADTVSVDSGAAVVVTPDALGGRDGNGELTGSYAIKFENDNGTGGAASGSVTFNGGKVLLAGAFSADDFADNNVQLFVAETVAGLTGTVTVSGGDNALQSTNGVLVGSINSSGAIVDVTVDDIAFDRNITHASAPVKELLYTAVDGSNVLDKSALGYEFLSYVGTQTNGQDAEAAARLATFGGVVQAGLMAAQTSADAVADRLGMANPNSALITSSNAQGGGLWIAPVYKNQDSDEFDAQGVDYGADIDLYGLALGADFTTESGVRVGALFNLGSGDANGQGVGSTVSNDFDYFGFTLYAGATFGNFALTADAGFTQLSNDLEQSTYMGTLKADTDTTVTSVGLRGEYLFATPWVDVVPHLGVRYTSLDMDSYDVHSDAGVLASTDADSIQVFSIPFGVTFSKDMAMGNWLVKPVFDLTLTANTGDDEIDSTTTFTGMQSVALSTEIMDSFTYGATLGINAQYQESFSFGLNVGYTGSSSADEFGLNANARYTF